MGFDVPELIERFTSTGTGQGQGGIPGHDLPLFVAKYTASITTPVPTTVRPPLVPTFIATYAGYNHHMFKHTPLHDSQIKEGGIFRNIGVWQRARYFSEDIDCKEEILNVRNNVGILDGSTLGKFRIHGPDALKALQRVYASDMSKVKEGRIKYSAMCNDDGCVIDDGVVVKLGENDYYFTTSSARAGQTVEWIRYHTRFDGWDFALVNLTDAMGVINLSGPNARKVLAKVVDIDLSNEAFPFSGYRQFFIKDTIFVRAMRLGFVGELSRAAPALLLYPDGLGHAERSRRGIRYPPLRRGSSERAAHGKGPRHSSLESEQRTNLIDLGLGFLWNRRRPMPNRGCVALHQAERCRPTQAGRHPHGRRYPPLATAPDCRQQGARLRGHHA